MKEHPLLFTTEMVRAILDGLKTQTRRVPIERYRNWKVGDTIWVRETWSYAKMSGYDARDDAGEIWYKATDSGACEGPWKPSIHMFRKYARIFLEITNIRDERVQDITLEDVVEEGIKDAVKCVYRDNVSKCDHHETINKFKNLWDSINAKRGYSWDKNHEVKVIEFKRI